MNGTEYLLVLGRYPELSLPGARTMAIEARDKLFAGIDPRTVRLTPSRFLDLSHLPVPTFGPNRVYFLQEPRTDNIKIGVTLNVQKRVAALSTGRSEPLKILGAIPGGFAHESRLHKAFAHYRTSGEWFKPGPRLLQFIPDSAAPC
jgi:hypothetical protein